MDDNGWDSFLNLCLSTQDKSVLDGLFDLLFTLEEKQDLSTRVLIIKELIQQKKPQRSIAKDLNVSIAKITRGSNALKRTKQKITKYLLEVLK